MRFTLSIVLGFGLVSGLGLLATTAMAQDAQFAVAANFTAPAQQLADDFKAKTGKEIGLSVGATGALYVQVTQGAPFDGFISADVATPDKLKAEGYAKADPFTYALGSLVLFGGNDHAVPNLDVLKSDFTALAIAQPETAPYGAAAVEVLKAIALYDAIEPKLAIGQSIGQTHQFVDTGNAEYGFVALSQVIDAKPENYFVVSEDLYQPIVQNAVLLTDNGVAKDFLDYIQSDEGHEVILSFGYKVATE